MYKKKELFRVLFLVDSGQWTVGSMGGYHPPVFVFLERTLILPICTKRLTNWHIWAKSISSLGALSTKKLIL
jgi:hypothetical protein